MSGLRLDPKGSVVFVGAGPGADDPITVRGARAVAEANIIIWTSPLVYPEIVAGHKPGTEIVDSASIPLEDLVPLYTRARDGKLLVARVHAGDPGIYEATTERHDLCAQIDIPTGTIPGISAFSATAARVDSELIPPKIAQSMILTRLEGGRTPMPEKETISSFAIHGMTMPIYLSAVRNKQLEATLLEGDYPPETPCAIGYRMTWPDEAIWRVQLKDLSATMEERKLWKHTIVLVGLALAIDRAAKRSHPYHPGFRHEYRNAGRAVAVNLREHGATTYNLESGDST